MANNDIPIEEGWYYWLAPNMASSNWVEVIEANGRTVRFVGVYPTITDQTVLRAQFDDNVRGFVNNGYNITTQDGDAITAEDGEDLFTEGV